MARKRTRYASDEVMRAYRRERARVLRTIKKAEKQGTYVVKSIIPPQIPKRVTSASVRRLQTKYSTRNIQNKIQVYNFNPSTMKHETVSARRATVMASAVKRKERKYYKDRTIHELQSQGIYDNYAIKRALEMFKATESLGFNSAYESALNYAYGEYLREREEFEGYEPYEPPSGGLSGYDYIQYFDPSTGEMAEFIEGYQPVGWIEADSYDNWKGTDGSNYYIERVRAIADQFNTSDAKVKWNQAIDSAINKSGRESVAKACEDSFENSSVLTDLANQVMTYEGEPMSSGYNIAFDLLEDALCDLSWAELHPSYSSDTDESGIGYNEFGGNGKYR